MSRDATFVVNPCAKFEMDMTYRSELRRLKFSIDRQLKVPIFTLFGLKGGSNFNFRFSNPQKALRWRERRILTYCAWGCVQKCNLWAWRRKEKRKGTFMRQTGYLPWPPTST